jgi:ArsR family transcriptional regulator
MNGYSYDDSPESERCRMSASYEITDTLCDVPMIHEDVVRDVQKRIADEEMLFDLAEFFKVFGDSTRIRILHVLSHAELCVCDISALLLMSQSAVSHQLRILKNARLVRNRRDGKVVYYSLDDEHVKDILNVGCEHLNEK